jgi:hypothetical protein
VCAQLCDQCKSGGAERCANGTCQDSFNDYQCTCKPGFTRDASGHSCVATPCSPNPCGAGNGCMTTGQTYKCSCAKGQKLSADGKSCESICAGVTCLLGVCEADNTVNGWHCKCNQGYRLAEGSTTLCEPVVTTTPCTGKCVGALGCEVQGTTAVCTCAANQRWTGTACVNNPPVNPCEPNPCGHGTCNPQGTNFSCKCDLGYAADAQNKCNTLCSGTTRNCDGVGACEDTTTNTSCGDSCMRCTGTTQCIDRECKQPAQTVDAGTAGGGPGSGGLLGLGNGLNGLITSGSN